MPIASLIDFVLLAAIWGASFLFTRIAVVEFGALPTAFMRVAIAAAFLLPIVWARGMWPDLRKHWKPVLAIGVVSSGLPFVFFAFALLSITTGLSAILNATAPLFTALVAWWWMKDRPTGSRVAGLAIGFIGVALLSWDKATFRADAAGFAPAWAVLACLGATLCYGVAATATKRYLTGVPPMVNATGSQIGAAVALMVPAAFLWPERLPSANAWWGLVAVGVLCTGIAYVLYFRLIAHTGPARAVAVTFVIPVFALFYGAVFLGETVTPWMVLCGLVIVAGTALSTGLLKLPSLRPQP